VVIEQVVERWHRFVTGGSPGELDGLLADDVVFYSPIVHTPQRGRDITTAYVRAAAEALLGDGGRAAFHYTKQVLAGDVAVLEFETTVHGKFANGVDIIRCDEEARIVELGVMIRPLQAVNAVHESMSALLASMEVVADSPLAAAGEHGHPSGTGVRD
jgi:hypothetical protein